MFKVRERLGQREGGVVAPFPAKPKWGRWPGYLRIRRAAMLRERAYGQTLHDALAAGKYS
jgi:hypothetical protein